MAAITGIDFGVALNNTVIPATITLTDTGSYAEEVRATANYNAAGLSGLTLGTLITISVEESSGNYVTVTTYTTQAGDGVAATIADRIATAIDGVSGYNASDASGTLTVTARPGLGAAVNSGDLFFSWSGGSASTTFSGGVSGLPTVSGTADIEGWFRITQPDGITIDIGSALSPAVTNTAGTLSTGSGTLRVAIDGNFQKGQYTVAYNVAAAGYDNTTLTKQFTLSFNKPVAVITPTTDVFTPTIRMTDATVYTQTGATLQSNTRSWTGIVEDVGTPTAGNVSQFDMVSGGEYYFTNYTATLTANLTYQVTAATYVTLITRVTGTATTTATKPLTLQQLITLIEALLLQGWPDGTNCSSNTAHFNLLNSIFWLYKTQGENGNLNAVFEMYERMIDLIEELDTTDLYTAAVPDQSELTAYTWTL